MPDEPITEPTVETPAEPVAEAPIEPTNAVKEDRTKQQFEKLKEHNNQLKAQAEAEAKAKQEALAEAEKYKNLFESTIPQAPVTPQQTETPQVTPQLQGMIDENGYLDGNKLVGTLNAIEQRAKMAEEKAKQLEADRLKEKQEQRAREEKEATLKIYAKYPQLDPNNQEQFDPKFWKYVKNELESKARRGVMPSNDDYMNAADEVNKDFYEGREDMTKKDQEKKTEIENQKRQINATRPRSPVNLGYYEGIEEKVLTDAIRQGKRGAVGEMLRRKGL